MADLTFSDLVDHAVAYAGGTNPDARDLAIARRAVLAAYDDILHRFEWSCYVDVRRTNTVAAYTTGTIAYDQTTRAVTLTGGTWPTWAASGWLRLTDVSYRVASRTSGTVLVLDSEYPLPAAFTDGATYTLFRDTYPLDADVQRVDRVIEGTTGRALDLVGIGRFAEGRRQGTGPSRPRCVAVAGSGGGQALFLWPAPDLVYPLDYRVKRKPTALTVDRREKGKASVTGGTAVVTGSGTDFDAQLVGTVFRAAANGRAPATGPSGDNPAVVEATVLSVASATQLTLDANAGQTVASVSYCCSSPADIDQSVMGRFLLREVERQMRLLRRMEPTKEEAALYQAARTEAREADSRYFGPRVASAPSDEAWRLSDMPGFAELDPFL